MDLIRLTSDKKMACHRKMSAKLIAKISYINKKGQEVLFASLHAIDTGIQKIYYPSRCFKVKEKNLQWPATKV
jgi:glutamate 5-kinase